MPKAPTGTISFLFTDIVGSTRLWEKYPNQMGPALARHDTIVRSACENRNGHVFKTVGDSFCVAFPTPLDAVRAAIEAQRGLSLEDWDEVGLISARMGIHTGTAEFRDSDYFGGTLNRVSRIESAAHGGQILLSQITFELLEDENLGDIDFKSLGSRRLRNLDRPEHLFQVTAPGLKDSFPPPRSMEELPNNLPQQTTSFVGREHEVEEVRERLLKTQLLTLMGTGGTGKTRLALEVGAKLINEFRDGVWLVELAPVTDPHRVVEAVAMAIGAREEPERPLTDTLLRFLQEKETLLLLDNCEHLLTAVAALSTKLLRACPSLKIIAASRHSLGISGETTFPVPPLSIFDFRRHELTGPDMAEQLSQYGAVKLFLERATAVRPDFRVTNENAPALAEICSRLDGIPLAIELAAARVRVLDLSQIAARLGDRFRLLRGNNGDGHLPHQQTLQALIDWSYDLLTDPERILFRRLGVFVGGRSLEAIETVCAGGSVSEHDVLDLIQQLADKSLVSVEHEGGGQPRYTIIESVWQYAREKLDASGEGDSLRNRHLQYFLGLAEKAAPLLEGPQQKEWLDLCQDEVFNFRSALEWSIHTRQPEAGFRILSAIYRVVEIRGNLAEAHETILKLLALPDAGVSAMVKANFLVAASRIAWAADRYQESRRFHEQAREIFQELGAEGGVGLCEMLTGFLDRGDGRLAEAEHHFQSGVEIGDRLGNTYLKAGCLSGLGSIALDRADLERARQLKEESLELYEKMGDHWIIGLILWGIVQVCIAQKDYARARSALTEWTRITRDLGNRWILPHILDCHANLAEAADRPEHAVRALGAATAMREHFRSEFSTSEKALFESSLTRLKSSVPEKDFQTAWEDGRRSSPWDLIEER